MSETYCGKSCQTCGYRAETSCRGCLEEASRECKLALCCRQKGHKTCDSCTYNTQCGMYRGRDTAPQYRLAQKKAELEYQQELRERGSFLAKWIWVLFWLFIPANIASVIVQWMPSIQVVGYLLDFACGVVYSVVLLRIASRAEGYRWAGILILITALLDGGAIFISNEALALTVSLCSAILSFFSCYNEFNAHADVLAGLDNELSDQWRKLWKWMLIATIAMIVGVIFTVIVIGALVFLAAIIALLVIGILKLVYLFRTAQTFQDVAAR